MARIRTIKPEFFTSEDIVALTPFARLLYVSLWCESDKEGRMVWKPKTFKMRYFPADSIDIDALCDEVVNAGLIVLYGPGYAYIPSFKAHQHINPRESDSQLPDPDASTTRQPRVGTRQARDSDVQGGREGKGKEGKTREDAKSRKTALPPDFGISARVSEWAVEKGFVPAYCTANLEAFVSYVKRNGKTYVDWDEALMTAIRDNWAKVPASPGGGPSQAWAGAK
jgi:hypothetical protein